jgi:hypothetical protein
MNLTLRFEPVGHRYFCVYPDGTERPVPSVTGIIGDLRKEREKYEIPKDLLDWVLDRGQKVHLCAKALIENRLKWSSVDPQILGRVQAIAKFLHDNPGTGHLAEVRLLSTRYQYAGTLDLVYYLADGRLAIVDWKGMLDGWIKLQLAAYSLAWTETHEKPDVVIGIQVRDDGTPKYTWGTRKPKRDGANFDLNRAEGQFLGSLTHRGFLVEEKLIKPANSMEVIVA